LLLLDQSLEQRGRLSDQDPRQLRDVVGAAPGHEVVEHPAG